VCSENPTSLGRRVDLFDLEKQRLGVATYKFLGLHKYAIASQLPGYRAAPKFCMVSNVYLDTLHPIICNRGSLGTQN